MSDTLTSVPIYDFDTLDTLAGGYLQNSFVASHLLGLIKCAAGTELLAKFRSF